MNKKLCFIGVAAALVLIVAIVLLVVLLSSTDDELIVVTNSGPARGIHFKSYISNFKAFYSIPYAKPPIGDLRFRAPEPIGQWNGIHDGTVEGPACPVIDSLVQNEDCLTLSVYTTDVGAQGKPVLVYIHGGALSTGSALMSSHGPHYFMKHDFIIVVVQFRLSIFGFLNLNMEGAPGNMALADVIEALKWTQANIHYFGGDPQKVTLGGLSSGGIMAHALLLSPVAQGLFNQIFIQSGTLLSYRFYNEDIESSIQKTKTALEMDSVTNEQLLDHLKTLSTSEILQITQTIQSWYPSGYAVYYPYPITRDILEIMPRNPLDLIRENNYRNIPMIIGITSDEGIRLETSMDRLEFVNDNFYMVVPTDLYPIDDMSMEKNATAQAIKDFYFGTEALSRATFSNYARLCTDSWYGHITDYVVRLQASVGYDAPVYYYRFAVDGAYNIAKIESEITSPGASHGDDYGYLWSAESIEYLTADDDYSDLSRERMISLFSNFIKNGNPTPEVSELLPVKWETIQYPTVNYLLINNTLSLYQNPERERLQFWQRLYGWPEL